MGDILKDKIVIVTGGAGLIGKALITGVVEHGGTGIVADIDRSRAETVASELQRDLGKGTISAIDVDITSRDSLTAMFAAVSARYRTVDAIVNNAYPRNRNYGRKFFDVEYADFCENVSMHLGGYFLVAQQAALFFTRQGHGNIINMSSIYGVIAPRFEIYEGTAMTMPVEYAAIKSAIIHLTRYMAKYLQGKNIRVNAISPGGILDRQPSEFLQRYNAHCSTKGMLDGTDIIGTTVYLLSDLSSSVTGQNIVVDDGFSL